MGKVKGALLLEADLRNYNQQLLKKVKEELKDEKLNCRHLIKGIYLYDMSKNRIKDLKQLKKLIKNPYGSQSLSEQEVSKFDSIIKGLINQEG